MQDFSFSFPICKIDRARREIRGVGTSEILDQQGEVLSYDGSKAAFAEWADGVPLREMHQPVAAGRAIQFDFDDPHRQVWVTAFVSKGSQDVWEKVLDGTLRMLSVGGKRIVSTMKRAADLPRRVFALAKNIPDQVRWTERWQLQEISLVDSGANPACAFEVVKSAGGVEFRKRAAQDSPTVLAQVTAAAVRVFAPLQAQFADLRRAAEEMQDRAEDIELQFSDLGDLGDRLTHLEGQVPKPSPAKVATPIMTKAEIRAALRNLPPGDPRRETLEIELFKQ
ncbi:MAG: hypothetical protein MUP80_16415 [Acidobacteriia bacterium]|nr:hypothetical protein [Terriglobia bacterium]